MVSSKALPFLSVLIVLLPMIAMGDDLSTFYEKVCEEVECGKGTCVANISYPLNYKCQCDPGWKRTKEGDDDLEFLPCVIPECSLDYKCQPAPPPVPATKEIPYNLSYFDPCYWVYCGVGTCKRTFPYASWYTCSCNSGYYNLLNYTFYPCYSPCTIGSDCANLGIKISSNAEANTNATVSPAGSPASSILPGKFHWMIILLLSMLLVLRN